MRRTWSALRWILGGAEGESEAAAKVAVEDEERGRSDMEGRKKNEKEIEDENEKEEENENEVSGVWRVRTGDSRRIDATARVAAIPPDRTHAKARKGAKPE